MCRTTEAPLRVCQVPEQQNLAMWFSEVHKLEVRNTMHANQALRAYSGAILPKRAVVTLALEDGKVVRRSGGIRAHSKEFYLHRWEPGGARLRQAVVHPAPPLPLNSLSRTDALLVSLYTHGRQLDPSTHPGWYNQSAHGDERRSYYSGDLGSENVNFSNMHAANQRVWRATLGDPANKDHSMYKPFASCEEARAHVQLAGILMERDNVAAPLHNDMTILKSLGRAHLSVAALDDLRQLINLPRLDWEKEGKTFRAKKVMLTSLRRAWYTVGVRRFHTQPGAGAQPGVHSRAYTAGP